MRRSLRDGSEVLFILFVLFLEASQLCLCQKLTDGECIEEERQALLKFRDSFDNYSRSVLDWEGKQCCKWKGVKCDAISGHVVTIDLSPETYSMDPQLIQWSLLESCILNSSGYVEGKLTNGSTIVERALSSEALSLFLLELKHLSHLDLSFIDFQGSVIPVFLGSMKQLRYLNLSYSCLSGRVPHPLGNLTNLQILDLSRSFVVSPLEMDDFTWVSHLSSLKYIDMSGVTMGTDVNSVMQVILNLPSLLQAHFEVCGFHSSKIPHGFVNSSSLPSKLQVLNLEKNYLNVMPNALQNMTSLTFLDISSNILNSVPLWLGLFRFLVHLNLSWNELTSSFPIAIQNISFLEFLDLSHNHLTSAVPIWFIKRVQYVYLDDNQFSTLQRSCPSNPKINCNVNSLGLWLDNKFQGETFGSFDNISVFTKNDIQKLDLSHNELKDSLESLGQLKNLMYLNLASNSFHGSFPSSFRNMTKLRGLFLEDNQLNGTIPAFFGRFSTLSALDLSGNRLTGVIPDNIGKLQNLRFLDLSNNSLEGTLKQIHLDNLSYLQDLRIGNNNLSMKLSPNWLPPFQLENLELHSCKIDTPFPQWLGTQKKLPNLYLSDTGIWGEFPKWFYQEDLMVLDLSKNKISGQLPTNLHEMMPNLSSLFLGDNLLNGSIPKSLCKYSGLQDLDLSNNKLSNDIPSCLGKIDSIQLIDLSSNELIGTIPESFCSSYGSYSSLQSLNLSNNSLHGELPSTLRSCPSLEILDLGNNELHGIIPSNIWVNSSVLKILRLRQNNFGGTIPSILCRLPHLQSLDLASNKLIGTIPFCLGNLKGMTLNTISDNTSMGFLAPGPANGPIAVPAPGFEGWPAPGPSFERWGKEDVKQVMKGIELGFTKNLKFVVNLDLSNNSLIGSVPEVLTSLTRLISMNLSHNYLSGEIPKNIGKMKQLESLDLSWNQLVGPLPSSMSSLTYLSHLNLSYNNFSGPIPKGNQFSTLEDSSIYVGNQYLCGEPVLKKCFDNNTNEASTSVYDEVNDEKEKILFYFVVAIGFMTGFWGIIAFLVLNKSLRYVCFRYMEKLGDDIYVAVAIRVARLKRMGFKPW